MESGFCPFLGWLRCDTQGDVLVQSYAKELVSSPFVVDQCSCVPVPTVSHVRQPVHLSAKHTHRTEFWCFFAFCPHPRPWERAPRCTSRASESRRVANIQEPFTRQEVSCRHMTEVCSSKQTAVSIVLNMLHVRVRKQNAAIS